MVAKAGLQLSVGADLDEQRRGFEAEGWTVLVLPPGITGRDSFFGGIRAACPLDPPLVRNDNWDALSDSLWNGIDELEDSQVAILWPDSTAMATAAPLDFGTAREILSGIAESLGDSNVTVGRPTLLAVVLL